ncbi:MAG: site-specific integrase, partial [Solirubrobacterales bacterium]|nr:site-specific integrase [Solirubrobacterales bacterium]
RLPVSTPSPRTPTYHLTVRTGAAGSPYWEVRWRYQRADGTWRKVMRRLGPAHLERRRGSDEWHRPRTRAPAGTLDDRAAHPAAAALVAAEHERLLRTEAEEAEQREAPVTFREVAGAFLDYSRDVKGTRPSTLRDYANVLAEPGTPHRRGKGRSPGHVMAALGDLPAADVTTADVNRLLLTVARTGASASTVNKYRRILSSIYGWAGKPSTLAVPTNPAADADRRREPPRQPLDYLGVEEVEALARALADGRHRAPADATLSAETRERDRAADQQDAELVRIAAYTGLRRGELLALRWADVSPELDRVVLRRVVSDGIEVDGTKSGKVRDVPLADPAARAFARLRERGDFTSDTDYVAASTFGERLDGSAFRRRVLAARDAIGLRPIRLHDLRHSFGSLLVAGGIDLVSVKAAYGHANISTTERYLHARPAREQAARFTAALDASTVTASVSDNPAMAALLRAAAQLSPDELRAALRTEP